jgi:disulfide bond formation protein DsbB
VNLFSGDINQRFNTENSLIPCELCRYARILMYPMVWFSGMALIFKHKEIIKYLLPISIVGICLESYHYLLQKVDIPTSYFCTASNPCDALQVNYL